MNKRYRSSVVFLGIISIWVVCANAQSKSSKANSYVNLDLRSGTVGKIGGTENLKDIIRVMGKANVKAFSYEAEGDTYQAYEVMFENGEVAKLYLSHFEITSPNFRTKEGLGVGSTWAEFKKAYSDGEIEWLSDANAVWSEKYKFRLYFPEMKEPTLKDTVTEIHVNRSIVNWE